MQANSTSKFKAYVIASQEETKIEHALQSLLNKLSNFVPNYIPRQSTDWLALLSEQLCHLSLWDDHYVIIVRLEEKDIRTLTGPWFYRWLEENRTPHRLIITLKGCYARKQKPLLHRAIQLQDLYDTVATLSPNDKEYVQHDKDAMQYLNMLKSKQPTQYIQWLESTATLPLEERIATLKLYIQDQPHNVFLTFVQIILGKLPLDQLLTLDIAHQMECYNFVAAWVRIGLVDEENKSVQASVGLMKWPDAKMAWQQLCRHTTRSERTLWYQTWLEQETILKGAEYPLSPAQAWQRCAQLAQQWKHSIVHSK